MKAPNGKKSNLNEKQWLLVRTKAFKRWFGDWENDPANASKVVDENVLVAVRLNTFKPNDRIHRVNRITSLYGKDKIEQLLTHKMLCWNNEKARRWTGDRGLQLPTVPYPERAYEDNVYTPADLVKYKMQSGLS